MAISRRFFLKSGTLTALAASVVLRPNLLAMGQTQTAGTNQGFQIPITAQQDPTYMFTRETFDPYVGGIFQVPDARGRMVNLTLLSAKSNTTSPAAAKVSTGKVLDTDSFSLMFRAARTLPPFTSIYTVSHPSLGKFDLFLTPRTQDGVFYYEAVFNHI